ncbi:MAG: toxin-antitoxin system protein [Gemmatimonadota bacterium]
MPTTRISPSARQILRQMAEETGESQQQVLEKALEHYRRQRFLAELNAAFASLREDEAAWREELAEREAWESTLADGLEQD